MANSPENFKLAQGSPDARVFFFRKWASLVVLSLALAIIIIDTTLLNVALRTIINDLHTTIQSMQWVITAYSLMLAAFTITGGRLGDLFGRKRMFIAGAIIFAIGSFIASVSTRVSMMIAGEAIIEGVGAALMMPATASLLVSNYKGKDRSIAFGVWGGIAGASAAIGPILGGWLTTAYSWRWGFRINVVVAAALLIGSVLIKESFDKEEKPQLDIVGVILSALGLLSIVFGFIKSSDYGWIKAKEQLAIFGHTLNLGQVAATPLFIILGIVILWLFMLWERRTERRGGTPLVSLEIFQNRQFSAGVATTGILALGQAGLFFAIPVFLQAVLNLDAFHTGLYLLPLSLTVLISAPVSAYLTKFLTPKRIVQIGLFLDVLAFIILYLTLSPTVTEKNLAVGLIVFGLGMGMMMAQISNLTLSAVSVEEAGEASGINNTVRQIGSTLGSAILGAILISSLTANLSNGILGSKTIPDNFRTFLATTISKHTSQIEFGSITEALGNLPDQIKSEIISVAHKAVSDANKTTLLYGAAFIFLGLLASFTIPSRREIEIEKSAAHIEEAIVRENKTEPVATRKAGYAGSEIVGAMLLVIIAAGIIGFLIGRHYKNPKPNNPLPAITENIPTSTLPNISSDRKPPAARSKPKPRPAAPTTNTEFSKSDWGISFIAPSYMHLSYSLSGDQIIDFYNSVTGQVYGSIRRIPAANTTLEEICRQLQGSPDVAKIELINFSGLPAVRFFRKTGDSTIAVIKNNALYYITGLNDHKIVSSFKIQ